MCVCVCVCVFVFVCVCVCVCELSVETCEKSIHLKRYNYRKNVGINIPCNYVKS